MDFWGIAIAIVLLVLLMAQSASTSRQRDIRESLVRQVYACSYQTKDYLMHLLALQKHRSQLADRLPSVTATELQQMETALTRTASALAVLTHLKARRLDPIPRSIFPNVALQMEDRANLLRILQAAHGPDAEASLIDLDDSAFLSVRKVLQELSD